MDTIVSQETANIWSEHLSDFFGNVMIRSQINCLIPYFLV